MRLLVSVGFFSRGAHFPFAIDAVIMPWIGAVCLLGGGALGHPPIDLGHQNVEGVGINYASAAVTHEDGVLESFFRRSYNGAVCVFSMRSADNGRTWSKPKVLVRLSVAPWGGPVPLLDRDGELHFVIPRVRGEGRKPAIDRFIDLYHIRSSNGRTQWSEPRRIFEGYCGAIQGLFQLSSGRIIAPFADWLPGVATRPPTGPSETTAVYSDDGGQSWRASPSRLTAPCYENYNGGNYGACEPTLIELKDGRSWMFIRTQAGSLYESFSADGARWSPAVASRFVSSNSPAFPVRLRDGRIILFWNNCVMCPRVDGAGVYAGRDALHAAISSDEGKSWRGFREVYRDPTRNGTPPKNGDRGTAYPHATVTIGNKVLLVSGQGEERRRRFLVDPDWLEEKRQHDDLANTDAWHLFKGFGPIQRWWRDRQQGPRLIQHPDDPQTARRVLHVRRPDELPGDGAVWNFPAGASGKVTLRVRQGKSCGGGQISLTDRMYNPCDDQGEREAVLKVAFGTESPSDGEAPVQVELPAATWSHVTIRWTRDGASVQVDNQPSRPLKASRQTPNGLSYLRLRSLASEVDNSGFLVDSVHAEVD